MSTAPSPPAGNSLRVLVCTANLGNARPDEASIEALIPPDGCVSQVLDDQTFPVPTREQQESLMSEIGFNTVVVRRRRQHQQQQRRHESGRPQRYAHTETNHDSWESRTNDGRVMPDDHFDIIVLGFQEATFDVDANDPIILAVEPKFRKALGKINNFQTGTPSMKSSNKRNDDANNDTTTKIADGITTSVSTATAIVQAKLRDNRAMRKLDSVGQWLASNDTKLIGSMLHQRCPSYNFIVRFQRGEMRLEILTHHHIHVELLSLAAQNTGIGVNGIMNAPNKGGIVAELLVERSTRISFCTTHLQAHEGRDKYDDRCRMTCDILDGTTPEGPVNIDLALRSHFMFFLGDLNFRTELPNGPSLTKEQHHQKVMALVEDENWRELNLADELFKALRDKDCLVGFKTLPCFFPPTFKVERCLGVTYKNQRRPSYTDRILWTTMHKLEDRIEPLLYEPVLDFSTSDHKPIRGAFKIKLNDRIEPRRPKEKKRMTMSTKQLFLSSTKRLGGTTDSKLHLFVSDIKCSFRKRAMAPNPVVVFMSFPYALVQEKVSRLTKVTRWFKSGLQDEAVGTSSVRKNASGFPRTKKLKATYQPQWLDELHVVVATHDKEGKPFDLTGCVIFVVVVDKTHTIEDRVIGVLPLNLAHLAMSTSEAERPPLTRRRSLLARLNSMSDLFTGNHEQSALTPAADNSLLHMKRPLTKNGKQTGWISMTLDSKWLADCDVNVERARRTSSMMHRTRSVREVFGRGVTMVEATEELPASQSFDALEVSQNSYIGGRGGASHNLRQHTTPKSPAHSVATWH